MAAKASPPTGARLDQGVADRGVEPHFFVDRLAAGVEFVGVRTFGLLEYCPIRCSNILSASSVSVAVSSSTRP